MRAVWPDSFVEESNLTRNIFSLRKVLSPNGGVPHYIETVPNCGYRFVGEMRALAGERAARATSTTFRATILPTNSPASSVAIARSVRLSGCSHRRVW